MVDWMEARRLFLNGRDTKQIAERFGVPEHEIYNGLAAKKWMNWRLADGKLRCGYAQQASDGTCPGVLRQGNA